VKENAETSIVIKGVSNAMEVVVKLAELVREESKVYINSIKLKILKLYEYEPLRRS